MQFPKLSVLKFGGSSLARPEQIQQVAKKICERHLSGEQLIVVVSAMGKTTDELMRLAHQVSTKPSRRELDMLLTTGERVSMALLSMALQDLNVPSISLTGSQAGIMTDGSFSNAKIVDLRPIRVEASLHERQVVVIAGFQGVEPQSKEITTLGRGGSDTTAVAFAAHFGARRCEILKDVDGVFSADPMHVKNARCFEKVPVTSLMEMCYWGAKVLHYRSVRLANRKSVALCVGRSNSFEIGTQVLDPKESQMFEQFELVSVNSHSSVVRVFVSCANGHEGLSKFKSILDSNGLPWPQILTTSFENGKFKIMYTADTDTMAVLKSVLSSDSSVAIGDIVSSVTATCFGAVGTELPHRLNQVLHENNIVTFGSLISPLSVTFFVAPSDRENAIRILHSAVRN